MMIGSTYGETHTECGGTSSDTAAHRAVDSSGSSSGTGNGNRFIHPSRIPEINNPQRGCSTSDRNRNLRGGASLFPICRSNQQSRRGPVANRRHARDDAISFPPPALLPETRKPRSFAWDIRSGGLASPSDSDVERTAMNAEWSARNDSQNKFPPLRGHRSHHRKQPFAGAYPQRWLTSTHAASIGVKRRQQATKATEVEEDEKSQNRDWFVMSDPTTAGTGGANQSSTGESTDALGTQPSPPSVVTPDRSSSSSECQKGGEQGLPDYIGQNPKGDESTPTKESPFRETESKMNDRTNDSFKLESVIDVLVRAARMSASTDRNLFNDVLRTAQDLQNMIEQNKEDTCLNSLVQSMANQSWANNEKSQAEDLEDLMHWSLTPGTKSPSRNLKYGTTHSRTTNSYYHGSSPTVYIPSEQPSLPGPTNGTLRYSTLTPQQFTNKPATVSSQRFFEARGPKPLLQLLHVLEQQNALTSDMLTALLIHFLPTLLQRTQKKTGRINSTPLSVVHSFLLHEDGSLTPAGVLVEQAILIAQDIPSLIPHAERLRILINPSCHSQVPSKHGTIIVESIKAFLRVVFKDQVYFLSRLAVYLLPLWKPVLCWCSSCPSEFHSANDLTLDQITHWGFSCDACHREPILGPRFQCETCSLLANSYCLCASCFLKKIQVHFPSHTFRCFFRDVYKLT